MLPEDRVVPSTLRYNLVWADQIVPNWVTAGQVEFAAKNYVGTQKIWAEQIAEFRNYNSNFLGLIYHLALGLNPESNLDCPNPKNNSSGFIGVVSPKGFVAEEPEHFKPWLMEKGIMIGSQRHEDMFQHYDELTYNNRVWHIDPYWLMNAENEDWQNYLNDQCIDWMRGNDNEGCFFDVSVETYATLYNPNQYNPSPTNFNWWQSPHKPYNFNGNMKSPSDFATWMNNLYLKYYQNIYRNFHRATADYLVIPNVDQMITTVYDPIWLDGDDNGETIDGAMVENFGGARGQDMYLTLERCISHITGRGKILIAQFNADTPKERLRRTAMYMLVKNENSFININPGIVGWYPEYEIDLGEQTNCPKTIDKISNASNLFERRFEFGRVICNTSDNPQTIEPLSWLPEAPGKEYIILTSGGGEVEADGITVKDTIEFIDFTEPIQLAASDCIMIKVKWGSPVEEKKYNYEIELYPNPVIDYIDIFFPEDTGQQTSIKIIDVLGNCMIVSGVNVESKKRIDVSNLSTGVYFVVVDFGKVRKVMKVLKN